MQLRNMCGKASPAARWSRGFSREFSPAAINHVACAGRKPCFVIRGTLPHAVSYCRPIRRLDCSGHAVPGTACRFLPDCLLRKSAAFPFACLGGRGPSTPAIGFPESHYRFALQQRILLKPKSSIDRITCCDSGAIRPFARLTSAHPDSVAAPGRPHLRKGAGPTGRYPARTPPAPI